MEKDNIFHTTERERRRRREPRAEREDDQERRRREVVALISAGQISRAMSRVTSHGLASMEDAAVMVQVAANILQETDLFQPEPPKDSLWSTSEA